MILRLILNTIHLSTDNLETNQRFLAPITAMTNVSHSSIASGQDREEEEKKLADKC